MRAPVFPQWASGRSRREEYRQLALMVLHFHAAVLAAVALGVHIGAGMVHKELWSFERKD